MAGITRTTSIPQANIFGRVGSGIGQGLAEQLPKEVERGRLAEGLNAISQRQDLSPFQQFSALVSTPGITPQMIQSAENLLRRQGIAQGFGRPNRQLADQGYPRAAPSQGQMASGQAPSGTAPSISQNVPATQSGQPQIVPENPLQEKFQPAVPWTPERRADEMARQAERHPHLSFPELKEEVDRIEAAELAQPEGRRQQQQALRDTQDRIRNKLQDSLSLKLKNKKGEDISGTISGEMQNNLIRGMERDLAEHPNKSEDDVVNAWSQKALDLAKSKTQLIGRSERSNWALPILLDKDRYRREIEADGEAYRKAGNAEEFYNDLQTHYGFSPIASAYLAYPPSKNVKSYVNQQKEPVISSAGFPPSPEKSAMKAAIDIAKVITPDDSILSIAKELKYKNPWFDTATFFQQLQDNADEIGLTARQKRELGQSGQLVGNWADFLILPFSGGRK